MRRFGVILLSIWLILTGLLPFLDVNLPNIGLVLAILAIAAGVFLLVEGWGAGAPAGRRRWRYRVSPGVLLLAVYLILVGILPFLNISLPGINLILAILAIAAGVLLLVWREGF